jgi:hypothetical protein
MNRELIQRITNYLAAGGLVNPELMEHEKVRDLLIDCRDELAKPEQEPVAWMDWNMQKECFEITTIKNKYSAGTPLYTSSPKPWVGLTDDEIHRLWLSNHRATEPSPFSRVIEAKLKEKNT